MNYVLITNDAFVGNYETYNEALDAKTKYELDDLDTNSNIEYQILLQEDYITNKVNDIRKNLKALEEKKGEIIIGIINDLNKYQELINKII